MLRIASLTALTKLESFLASDEARTRKAFSLAINDTLDGRGLARFRTSIESQIDFPSGYVGRQRLYQAGKASPNHLEGSIIGRQRPTSLARFASGGAIGGKGGVTVKVKKSGGSSFIKSAFLVRLKSGNSLTDDSFNTGLAIRLKPGQTVVNKRDVSNMVHLEANVVLLYGPSIDQILRNDVADEDMPIVADDIATEFFRQYSRLAG